MNINNKNNNKNESKKIKKFNKGGAIAIATVLSTTLITPLSVHAEGLNNSVNSTSNSIENNNIDHVKVVNEISKGDIVKFGIIHSKNLKDIKIINSEGYINGKDYTYAPIDNNLLTLNIKKNISNFNEAINNFKIEGINKNNNKKIEIPLSLSKLPEINLSTTNVESPVSLILKCTSTSSKENISTTTGANTTDVMYRISYQFRSNTGKYYKITNVKIVPNYKIAYNNPNDMKYKNYLNEALKSLNDNFYSFNTTMGISNFDSTSTGVMILESNYIKSDYNTHLEGTATVYYTIDGKQYKENVSLPNAKLFGGYKNVVQQPKLYYGGQDKKNNAKYVSVSIQNPLTNLKYYYIPSQYMIGNPILNITASGGAILSINPQYANDIKYLGNNNYQLTNKLYNSLLNSSGLNLFEVSNPHPEKTLQTDISINGCNYNFPNIKFDSSATLGNANLNLTFTPEIGEYAINKHLTVTGYSNNNDQCMLMSGKTTNKNLNNLNKNYNLYSVIMGYSPLLLKMNSTKFINPNYRYVSYPDDYMLNTQYYYIENEQSGIYTKDEINNRIYDIVTGKSVSGVTVYSGQQLIDMANSGKQLPNIYMVIAKGTSISDVATTGVANMALGITPSNYADYILVGQAKTDMHNSTLYKGWDKLTDTNRDSIVKDNNKLEGFVLGGIVDSYTGENQGTTETFGPSNVMTQTNQSSAIMFNDVRGPGIDTSSAMVSQLGIDPIYTFSGPNGYTTFNMTPEEFYKPTTYSLYSDYKLNPGNNADGAYYTFNIGNNTFTKDSYMEFIYKDKSNNIKHFNVPLSEFSRDSSGDYYYPLSKLPDFKSFNIEIINYDPQPSLLHIQFTTKEPEINQKYYCGILTESGLKNGLVNTLTAININNSYINNYMININNRMYNEYQYYGSDPQVTNTNVSINSLANNSCFQKVTNVNRENNTFTINNSIKNNSGLATNYYAIGRIPSNRIKSLASAYGYNGIGRDTYSTMESINIQNGTEVYLIPKTLESKYNDILNTQSISSLSNLSKLIKENNSGLVKYKSGMSLNDYIGYIVKSQLINPGKEFNFNIGIKCNGVLKNEKNTMYSGFKYYDSEHNYGSISPIQELNLQDIFKNKVIDSLIQSTKNGEELSGVKYEVQFENGKTVTVTSDKNGSVNIPTGIIKKVNIVSVPYGWKVDSNKLDTVNNENEISTTDKVVLSKLNTIVNVSATCNNQDVSGVTFDLGKDGDMTTSNKDVSKTFDYNSVNSASIKTIPAGYKADGNISITRTTDKDGNQVINIVQKLTKIPKNSITVSMVNSKGDVIVKPQTVTDYDGSKVLVPSISVPNGYKLVNITDNGQVIDKLPSSITNKNQNIVYHVIKENTSLTIKYMYNGQEIGEPVNKEIATGSIINNNYINAPSGYKVDNITFDGKTVKDNILNEKASVDPNIVIVNLSKLKETVNVSAMCDGKEVPNVVINVNGKNLTTSTGVISENIPYGSFKDAKVSNIPNGYELNGNITINKTVDKDGNITINVIQNLKKLAKGTVTTIVKDTNGNIIDAEKSYTGYENTKDTAVVPTIPQGYKVISITNNNIKCDGLPKYFNSSTQNIVITVNKEQFNVTTKVIDESNHVIVPSKTTKVDYGSGVDKLIPAVPNGYKLIKYVCNNKDYSNINEIPKTVTSNDNITVIVQKIEKGTINVEVKELNNSTPISTKTYTGDVNSKDTATVPNIPKGYRIVSITNNGQKVNGLPQEFTKETQNVVYQIEKIPTPVQNTKLTIKVENMQGQEIEAPINKEIKVGSKLDNNYMPSIPAKYKIVNVETDNTNTGLNINGIAKNGENTIIIKVENKVIKEPVSVTVKDGNSILIPTITKEVNKGTVLNGSFIPNIPTGYKVDSIYVNNSNEGTSLNGEVNGPTNIIVNVSKIVKGSINVTVKDINNNIIVPTKSATGEKGSKDTLNAPIIPSGYKIVSITDNGKVVDGMPKEFTGETQSIIYTVKKINTKVTTEVITQSGQVVTPKNSFDVPTGTSINSLVPNAPSQYKVVGVKVNGKEFTSKADVTGITNGTTENIIVIVNKVVKPVEKEGKVIVEVQGANGNIIVPAVSTTGVSGTADKSSIPSIPVGYKLDYITNNGQKVNGLPEKYNDGTQTIIYHVSKIVNKSTISIVTKSTDGKILVGESSVSGVPGTPTALGLDIPSGYHLVKIIDNGKEIKSLPQKFNNENQNIEIIAEKNKDNIIKPVNNTPNNIPTTNKPNISNNNSNNSPITISHNNKTNNNTANINEDQNPKTGDTSELPFALGILAALGALIGINVKKKKTSTEKIDN
ncbi:hypothetical protein HMPREF1092_03185 [Clostridium thermobutyricum]|uniref:Uncharacterized protein n=1 Tax=Clostridium thermobutyricum TaxID=29372 RepID=N9XII1_9CLOT|nr:hypothetical protein [Clostridium thermobutyricum]ENY99512.1 hypothetical protein HMPREF1092_03185 [Clostridium thermobutyricum]